MQPIWAVAAVALVLLTTLTAIVVRPPGADASVHEITLPIAADRLEDVHWTDTWGASRSGGRSHIGVDVMGPKMIPLVAAADAVVTWGRFNNSRGSIIRLRADDGWEYQYIHLNNDTPGTDDGRASCGQALSDRLCRSLESDGDIIRGTRVSAGEVIGYLGDSGNAEWTGSHLHFETYSPDGRAVNPAPIFTAAAERVRNGETGSPEPALPAIKPGMTADQKLAAAVARLEANPPTAQVDRLYLAFFLRPADGQGLDYWVDRKTEGRSLEEIAEWFAESSEFERRYGHLSFSAFLDQLYADVLHRPSDAEGKAYWLERLQSGEVSRGTIVVYFTEGSELMDQSAHRTELTSLARMFRQPVPTADDHQRWLKLRNTDDLKTAIKLWFLDDTPMR